MDRPVDWTRCYVCYERLAVVDTYETSKWDRDEKRWLTRWYDPDWVITQHIKRVHANH